MCRGAAEASGGTSGTILAYVSTVNDGGEKTGLRLEARIWQVRNYCWLKMIPNLSLPSACCWNRMGLTSLHVRRRKKQCCGWEPTVVVSVRSSTCDCRKCRG